MEYAVVCSNVTHIIDISFVSFRYFYCSVILCFQDLAWNKFPVTCPSLETLRDGQEFGKQRIIVLLIRQLKNIMPW